MGSVFNWATRLAVFQQESVTNFLGEPTAMHEGSGGAVSPLTTVAAMTGPLPITIHRLEVYFSDIMVDDPDPAVDTYLGWAIYSASDGGVTPTYTKIVGYTANTDLPLIFTDDHPTALLATVNIPYNLFAFVGGAGESIVAPEPSTTFKLAPVRVEKNTLFQVRLGLYSDGTLTAVAGVDNVVVAVYGETI